MNNEYYNTKLISSIGKTEKTQTTVLMLDIDGILSKIEDIDMEKIELPKEMLTLKKSEPVEKIDIHEEIEIHEHEEAQDEIECHELSEPVIEELLNEVELPVEEPAE